MLREQWLHLHKAGLSANCKYTHHQILQPQRMAALTGRTAALPRVAGGRLWAESNKSIANAVAALRNITCPHRVQTSSHIPLPRLAKNSASGRGKPPSYSIMAARSSNSSSCSSIALHADTLVLSRFSSGLFRAMFAMKEIWNGNEIHRRVSA